MSSVVEVDYVSSMNGTWNGILLGIVDFVKFVSLKHKNPSSLSVVFDMYVEKPSRRPAKMFEIPIL